jgi:sterol desaturase/sphingolipid hydroxylase (fatty acid hydroxylase superfamily)
MSHGALHKNELIVIKGGKNIMSKDNFDKISGMIGTVFIVIFVLGLAQSISAGAAGFWGGLPFWVICIMVIMLVFYDLWDTCLRKKPFD